jgi:predicted amidohydrolase YtcJ
LPGLADHHIHLRAAAAARRSLDLGGADLGAADDDGGTNWLRVIGAGVELTRADLDDRWPHRPVRVQHRSGALWTLNSAALATLRPGASEQELRSGQFWRSAARLRSLLDVDHESDLPGLGAQLAAFGVTHVTDATPDFIGAPVPQHVLSLGADSQGPRKIVIPDHKAPDLDGLVAHIRTAHDAGRGVALHVISAVAMAVAIAALREAGSMEGDRIEHAAVCSDDAAQALAELDVTVVTQPSIVARHGAAYLADSPTDERPLLWRYAGLQRIGVRVALSSDAPYGDIDPWRTVAAATTRQSSGEVIGSDERVAATTAFTSLLSAPLDPGGPPRRLRTGSPADLCLLGTSLEKTLRQAVVGEPVTVRATFIRGQRIWPALDAEGRADTVS